MNNQIQSETADTVVKLYLKLHEYVQQNDLNLVVLYQSFQPADMVPFICLARYISKTQKPATGPLTFDYFVTTVPKTKRYK